MKKLIPAICLLLVTAMLVGTSTYAWFTMNTTVTASGMSVKAQSTGGLAIGAYTDASTAPNDTAFASTADAVYNSEALALNPTSTATGETWYKATAASVESYAKTGSYTALTTSDDYNNYRLVSKFQVKSLDENTATTPASLYVTGVTVTATHPSGKTTGSDSLNKALRVAIVYGGKTYFFAPNYTSTDSVSAIAESGKVQLVCVSSETTAAYPNTITIGSGARASAIGTVTPTAADLTVYVYYEGEDPNCASVYAVNIDTLAVSVNFSTVAPAV